MLVYFWQNYTLKIIFKAVFDLKYSLRNGISIYDLKYLLRNSISIYDKSFLKII